MIDKRRKFNVRAFRNIAIEEEMISYAKKHLTCLGQGSSRIVFAYSHSKVLKIALNEKGYAQNAAELLISQNTETQKAISKIFDFRLDGEEKVVWLISEMVRTIHDSDEFRELSGFSWDVYIDTIKAYAKANAQEQLDNITSDISKQYSKRAARLKTQGDERNAKYYEKLLSELEVMKSSGFFNGIAAAMKINRLMSGDILELDHYGKTVNGTIVLFDYGFTEDIAKKYYPRQNKEKQETGTVIRMFCKDGEANNDEPVTRQEINPQSIRKRAV